MVLSNINDNSSHSVSKKFFPFDLEYLLVVFLFLIVLFGSNGYAFELKAPSEVVVANDAVFYVDLVNDSSRVVDLKLNFYAPADVSITAPNNISPNSTVQAKITIFNNFKDERIISGLVEASFDEQVLTKEVELHFKKKSGNSSNSSDFTGLFSAGSTISGFELFTLGEWIIFIVLAIICAVLLVSFIAKLMRRV